MKKTVSTILVGLMIIGMMGYIQTAAQERNELEELIGIKVSIYWSRIRWVKDVFIIEIKDENWFIYRKGKKYGWGYISTITYIKIEDKDYKPIKSLREIGKEMEEDDG